MPADTISAAIASAASASVPARCDPLVGVRARQRHPRLERDHAALDESPPCVWANSAYCTGEIQVSRKSAPNVNTVVAAAKS
jgi:hypothetical protein